MNKIKVLIFGITGMLGHTLFSELTKNSDFEVYGTVRNNNDIDKWFNNKKDNVIPDILAHDILLIQECINQIKPRIIINCIGIIKQLPTVNKPQIAISINALLPHQLAQLCGENGCRLIHISTDCVFNGQKGNYTEDDISDAVDFYGRTKFLGEVIYPHCVTLRTSIIGHELKGKYGLVEWFMAQNQKIRGYKKAIFSGFPTIELARIINDYVIPDDKLNGLYHVSSEPISKFDLLNIIAKKYKKNIEIEPYDGVCENRSLDSSMFRTATGYNPPSWEKLVDNMHQHYINCTCYHQF